MKHILTIVLLLFIFQCSSQIDKLKYELYGFRLGQYSSTVHNELGKPDQQRVLEDSSLVEFYFLDSMKTTHLAFVYENKTKEISTIQITGENSPISFFGINLSDNSDQILEKFPQPDTILNVDFNDKKVETWKYFDKNYSFVVKDNILNSIKIWDINEQRNLTSKTKKEESDINNFLKVLETGNNNFISEILSPTLEIYFCDRVITWENSMQTDLTNSESKVCDYLYNSKYGLKTFLKKKLKGELNIRYIENNGTYLVYKYPKGSLVEEIVLKYEQSRYKIWEVRYDCRQLE